MTCITCPLEEDRDFQVFHILNKSVFSVALSLTGLSSLCVQTVQKIPFMIPNPILSPLSTSLTSLHSPGYFLIPSSAVCQGLYCVIFPELQPPPYVLHPVDAPSDVWNALCYPSSEVCSGSLSFSMLCWMNYICELQHREILYALSTTGDLSVDLFLLPCMYMRSFSWFLLLDSLSHVMLHFSIQNLHALLDVSM